MKTASPLPLSAARTLMRRSRRSRGQLAAFSHRLAALLSLAGGFTLRGCAGELSSESFEIPKESGAPVTDAPHRTSSLAAAAHQATEITLPR